MKHLSNLFVGCTLGNQVQDLDLLLVQVKQLFSLLLSQEGAYVFFFGLAGIAAPQALALALLSRGLRLAVSLVGGVIYLLGK